MGRQLKNVYLIRGHCHNNQMRTLYIATNTNLAKQNFNNVTSLTSTTPLEPGPKTQQEPAQSEEP